MDQVLDQAVDEATGGSPRRWVLLLLLFVVGGIVALWLSKRASGAEPDIGFAAEVAAPPVAEPMAR